MNKKNKKATPSALYIREVRCPVHRCVIGRYDMRNGLTDAVFRCPKCKREYIYTIPPQKTS